MPSFAGSGNLTEYDCGNTESAATKPKAPRTSPPAIHIRTLERAGLLGGDGARVARSDDDARGERGRSAGGRGRDRDRHVDAVARREPAHGDDDFAAVHRRVVAL